jgi:hypothetical protein
MWYIELKSIITVQRNLSMCMKITTIIPFYYNTAIHISGTGVSNCKIGAAARNTSR